MTDQVLAAELAKVLKGAVITPEDPDYEAARKVFVPSDAHPLAIVRPTSADEVAIAVRAAVKDSVPLAVRGGGHGPNARGTGNGLVIDLTDLADVDIDVDAKTVSVGGGATAGAVAAATDAHGLAIPFGDTGTVGVGGITLTGGFGYLVRSHGLTVDSLLSAEIVTADGEIRQVTPDSDPELLWALTGGGGNFGVVTRFTFAAHEVRNGVGGMLILPAEAQVLRDVVDFGASASEGVSLLANLMTMPPAPFVPAEFHGQRGILILLFAADHAAGELDRLRAVATPMFDGLKPVTYAELLPLEESGTGPDFVIANLFGAGFDQASAESVVDAVADGSITVVQVRPLGGAYARVAPDATAVAHRDAAIMANVVSFVGPDSDRAAAQRQVDAVAAELSKGYSGSYLGFSSADDADEVRGAYGESTFERLRTVKQAIDPTNVFGSAYPLV